MRRIRTLGHSSKRTWFIYKGSITKGTTLMQVGEPFISPELYQSVLRHFSGQSIPGGFSMTDPIPGGFGEWIQKKIIKAWPLINSQTWLIHCGNISP